MRRGLLCIVLPVFIGCSSDESADEADTGPIEQPCVDYASGRCAAMERCAPALFAYEYGDMTFCREEVSAWCMHVGTLPGAKLGPRAIGSCSSSFSSMTCEAWHSRRDDPLCGALGGSLAVGETCVHGYQCSTKACFLNTDGTCGTCHPTPELGDACRLSMECPSEMSCIGYKCVRPSGLGESCDGTKPCSGYLLCVGGQCALSPALGQPCIEGICNNRLATTCQGGTCEALALVGEGEACGGTVYCSGSGTCTSQGVCRPPVQEGRPCSNTTGPSCRQPSTCVDGWCMTPDPSTCP